jgi:DNA-binding response OmpR family regulator
MSKRILIVDDEFGLADVVAEILTDQGYDAAIAINGRLGLAQIAEARPNLVLLDVMMPVLDGPTTLVTMRSNPEFASIPVIMMTALPEALPKTDPPLYQAVLYKPFTLESLNGAVTRLIGPSRKDGDPKAGGSKT